MLHTVCSPQRPGLPGMRWHSAGPSRGPGGGRRRSSGGGNAAAGVPAQLLAAPEQHAWQDAHVNGFTAGERPHDLPAVGHAPPPPPLATKPTRSLGSGSDDSSSGSGSDGDGGSSRRPAATRSASRGAARGPQPRPGGGGGQPVARRAPPAASSSGQAGEEQGESIVLAGRRYESLLELRHAMRHLQRTLLGGAQEAEVLPGTPEFATLQALFRRHPSYAQKVREPIRRFFVVRNPYVAGGSGCEFQFEDARGAAARDDFSLLKCTRIHGGKKRRSPLLEACSHAVEGQLREALGRAERGPGGACLCGRCGSDFKVEAAYVGGQTVSKLVHAYKESGAPGRPPAKFEQVPGSQQAAFRSCREDAAWSSGWVAFHAEHACLEPLCKQCQCKQAEARRAEEQRQMARLAAPGARDRRQAAPPQGQQPSQARFGRS